MPERRAIYSTQEGTTSAKIPLDFVLVKSVTLVFSLPSGHLTPNMFLFSSRPLKVESDLCGGLVPFSALLYSV